MLQQARHAHFLADNQLLVNFIDGNDLSDSPDWGITPFTQLVKTLLAGSSSSLQRIR
jgi:hypothetical protein